MSSILDGWVICGGIWIEHTLTYALKSLPCSACVFEALFESPQQTDLKMDIRQTALCDDNCCLNRLQLFSDGSQDVTNMHPAAHI